MEKNLYIVKSRDEEIIKKAECGGAVTSFLTCALEERKVDAVLTVKARDGNRFDGLPVLIDDSSELSETAGALHCVSPNISRYIKEYCGGSSNLKLAVVGKPCDLRGIIEMAKREAVNIENLLLVGVNCTGSMSEVTAQKMYKEEFGVDPFDVIREDIDPIKNKLTIRLKDGTEKEENLDELEEKGYGRRENCRRCDVNIPRMADIALGKWGAENENTTFVEVCSEKGFGLLKSAEENGYVEVKEAEKEAVEEREKEDNAAIKKSRDEQERIFNKIRTMNLDEKYDYWMGDFRRCIKCFGCLDACPICYCEDCILEVHRGMIPGGGKLPPEFSFNMIRVANVMDSCVNCGQCQDICPAEIPLNRLIFMLSKELQNVFGYEPGIDVDESPPLTFTLDEEKEIEDIEIDFSKIGREET